VLLSPCVPPFAAATLLLLAAVKACIAWTNTSSSIPLSVRNVVPTLTSNKRQGLSLDGRC
jgi:hypothetical protein